MAKVHDALRAWPRATRAKSSVEECVDYRYRLCRRWPDTTKRLPDHDQRTASVTAFVVITLVSLAVFGGVKGSFTAVPIIRSGLQTTVIGGLAAAAAFAIAR